ncbi:MAG TPA: hypothetical protein VHH88_02720, partial [Verrucomicrobiae bacterium]|nr:hypothetical protein [Verrucomicrobiae bacterium]
MSAFLRKNRVPKLPETGKRNVEYNKALDPCNRNFREKRRENSQVITGSKGGCYRGTVLNLLAWFSWIPAAFGTGFS